MFRPRSGSGRICELSYISVLNVQLCDRRSRDYKGLKKRINAVRREQSSTARDRSSSDDEGDHHASSDPLTDAEPLVDAEDTRLPPLPHSGDTVNDADDERAPSGTTVLGDSAGSGSEEQVKADHSQSRDREVFHSSRTLL